VFPADSATTYSYQIAPMDTNTAQANVTAAGVLTAARTGHVRVTVTASRAGVQTSESALVTIEPGCRIRGMGPSPVGHGSPRPPSSCRSAGGDGSVQAVTVTTG
jgi:beta-glucosidase